MGIKANHGSYKSEDVNHEEVPRKLRGPHGIVVETVMVIVATTNPCVIMGIVGGRNMGETQTMHAKEVDGASASEKTTTGEEQEYETPIARDGAA